MWCGQGARNIACCPLSWNVLGQCYINSDWLQIREFPEKADYARRHHVSSTAVLTFGNKDISWLETSAFSTSVLWLFFPLWNFPRKQVNLMCYTLNISNYTTWMPGRQECPISLTFIWSAADEPHLYNWAWD